MALWRGEILIMKYKLYDAKFVCYNEENGDIFDEFESFGIVYEKMPNGEYFILEFGRYEIMKIKYDSIIESFNGFNFEKVSEKFILEEIDLGDSDTNELDILNDMLQHSYTKETYLEQYYKSIGSYKGNRQVFPRCIPRHALPIKPIPIGEIYPIVEYNDMIEDFLCKRKVVDE